MRKTVLLLLTMILLVSTLVLLPNSAAALLTGTSAGSHGLITQVTIPAAPSDLTVTGVTSNSVSIAWTDNSSDEDGFRIEWCTGGNCTDFQLLATMPAGVNNISQWGLSKNRTYKYRVCAYNSAGDSGYTNIVAATTLR
jgi:titin